ncbi:MAG: cupredoxin domain-containing protein [Ostreibacterium sp.]
MKKILLLFAVMLLSVITTTSFADSDNYSGKDKSDMKAMKMKEKNEHSDVGELGQEAQVNKTIHVILSDNFTITFKENIAIKRNDVVRFIITNTGKIKHELMFGSDREVKADRKEMLEMAMKGMMDEEDEINMVSVKPGKTKQVVWNFNGQTDVFFACNVPGHAEAGMVKKIILQ